MAITNGELFSVGLDICRKESKGNAISPESFGFYLDTEQRRYFEQEFMKYESSRRVGDSLLPFVNRTSVSGTLPSDYQHAISAVAVFGTGGSAVTRPVDIVTLMEYDEMVGNNLLTPTALRPVMYFYRDDAEYSDDDFVMEVDAGGTTPDDIILTYLITPPSCIFDYYIDDEGDVQYLDEDETHTLLTDEEYRDGTDSGAVTSISQEMWWGDHDKLKILDMVLMRLGVRTENQAVFEYANRLSQTNAVQP